MIRPRQAAPASLGDSEGHNSPAHDSALVLRRLAAIEAAKTLGNVAEACRQFGIDRSSFFTFRKRYHEHGLEGLLNRPPIAKFPSRKTSKLDEQDICSFALKHPFKGCDQLAIMLRAEKNISVASTTIHKLLSQNGLGNAEDRWLAIEDLWRCDPESLTNAQFKFAMNFNPGFSLIDQRDTQGKICIFVVELSKKPRIFLHCVFDCASHFLMSRIAPSDHALHTIRLLHSTVLPFYRRCRLPIKAAVTSDISLHGYQDFSHPLTLYLSLRDIRHERISLGFPTSLRFRFTELLQTHLRRSRAVQGSGNAALRSVASAVQTWTEHYNFNDRREFFPTYGSSRAEKLETQKNSSHATAYSSKYAVKEERLCRHLVSLHEHIVKLELNYGRFVVEGIETPGLDLGDLRRLRSVFLELVEQHNEMREAEGLPPIPLATRRHEPGTLVHFRPGAFSVSEPGLFESEKLENAEIGKEAGNPATQCKCGAWKRDGTPCSSYPVRGKNRCRIHGGANGSGYSKANRPEALNTDAQYRAAVRTWFRKYVKENEVAII